MHKIIINDLGPIDYVELSTDEFMVFTGAQASGKSTIAKTLFFFKTIKDDLLSLIIRKTTEIKENRESSLYSAMESVLREKFLRVFGSSWGMDNDMYIECRYCDETFIKIRLEENRNSAPNFIWVDYSENIKNFLIDYYNTLNTYASYITEDDKTVIKEQLNSIFADKYDCVYIPAGRSVITLLATQLNSIYSFMEDNQKRNIDFCTMNYLERILKIRPEFENGLKGLSNTNLIKATNRKDVLKIADDLIKKILKGSYRYNEGDERLELQNKRYVKINFTSSGQQEAVWILNLLFYYLLNGKPTFFIIEEPESHLFPEAQKYISELIALVCKDGHSVLVTTHSPYVLGSLNNLLYASTLPSKVALKVNGVINSKLLIEPSKFGAWFVKDGKLINGMDTELDIINNELIDDISSVINETYNELLELRYLSEESGN